MKFPNTCSIVVSGIFSIISCEIHEEGPKRVPMEQHTLKNINNCLNTNIYSYLETSGVQSSNQLFNCCLFFQCQSWLEICGSLRQLLSCIGVYIVLFHCPKLCCIGQGSQGKYRHCHSFDGTAHFYVIQIWKYRG